MKYLLIILTTIFIQGCIYFNDRGISSRLYADCKESYDAYGNYIEECDKNIINYTEIKDNTQCQQSGIKIDTGCSSR